jgi:hypothetical protein
MHPVVVVLADAVFAVVPLLLLAALAFRVNRQYVRPALEALSDKWRLSDVACGAVLFGALLAVPALAHDALQLLLPQLHEHRDDDHDHDDDGGGGGDAVLLDTTLLSVTLLVTLVCFVAPRSGDSLHDAVLNVRAHSMLSVPALLRNVFCLSAALLLVFALKQQQQQPFWHALLLAGLAVLFVLLTMRRCLCRRLQQQQQEQQPGNDKQQNNADFMSSMGGSAAMHNMMRDSSSSSSHAARLLSVVDVSILSSDDDDEEDDTDDDFDFDVNGGDDHHHNVFNGSGDSSSGGVGSFDMLRSGGGGDDNDVNNTAAATVAVVAAPISSIGDLHLSKSFDWRDRQRLAQHNLSGSAAIAAEDEQDVDEDGLSSHQSLTRDVRSVCYCCCARWIGQASLLSALTGRRSSTLAAMQVALLAVLCFSGIFDARDRSLRPGAPMNALPIVQAVIDTQLAVAHAMAASPHRHAERDLEWALRVLRTVGSVQELQEAAIANVVVWLHEVERCRAFAQSAASMLTHSRPLRNHQWEAVVQSMHSWTTHVSVPRYLGPSRGEMEALVGMDLLNEIDGSASSKSNSNSPTLGGNILEEMDAYSDATVCAALQPGLCHTYSHANPTDACGVVACNGVAG